MALISIAALVFIGVVMLFPKDDKDKHGPDDDYDQWEA